MNIYLIGVLIASIIIGKFYSWWREEFNKKLTTGSFLAVVSLFSIIWPITFTYAIWFLFIKKGDQK